jgi:hypothetical protein
MNVINKPRRGYYVARITRCSDGKLVVTEVYNVIYLALREEYYGVFAQRNNYGARETAVAR